MKELKPGEFITFGIYPQTADGTDRTPIKWRVLQNSGRELFMLSEYILHPAHPVPSCANKERGTMEFSILYQELQKSTEMIRALLAGVAPEAARLKPSAESWSILEVMCHLYDEEREDFREHLDFILHRQNEEWHTIDTEGWVTQRKYNEQNFAEMQEKFFVEREKSFAWLKGLVNPDWEKTYTTEYRTISAGEMFACWVAHDNLHIRQLVELRRLRLENITKPYNLEYAGDW